MHTEAFQFVAEQVRLHQPFASVLEVGGRNINGTIRGLFHTDDYTALDNQAGPGVDLVADATVWCPDRKYAAVVCCEVFEHVEAWPLILATMVKALEPGGTLIVTAATDPRQPHSAFDGGPLRPGEFYANVDPDHLTHELAAFDAAARVRVHPRGDVYAVAHEE